MRSSSEETPPLVREREPPTRAGDLAHRLRQVGDEPRVLVAHEPGITPASTSQIDANGGRTSRPPPWARSSRAPPTAVATMGSPVQAASVSARLQPSQSEGRTNASAIP